MELQNTNSQIIKIAFTGHRDIDLGKYCQVRQEVKNILQEIIAAEPVIPNTENEFILLLGNAIGADKIAMDVCDELKDIEKLNISIDVIPSNGHKAKDYQDVGNKILKDAKYLVAMWDGTFNNKKGGTSDIVKRFGKNNPNLKLIKCERISKQRVKKAQSHFGYQFALGIFLFFLLIDALHLGGFSSEFASKTELFNYLKDSFLPSFLPALLFSVVYIVYKQAKNIKNLFLEFIFPLSIAFYTLVTGYIGFRQIIDSSNLPLLNHGDSLFAAANLLTLNSSIFKSLVDDTSVICLWLVNARILGGVFLAYAFFIALSFATGKENIDRLKFWWFRNILNRSYIVIIGDSRKALNIALNSANANQKVVFLYNGDHELMEKAFDEKDIIFMKGSSTSRFGLAKTYFHDAKNVYVLHTNDEHNFRSTQEMIEIIQENKDKYPSGDWHVHLSDLKQRDLLMSLKDKMPNLNIQYFDIHQNMVRNLVLKNEYKALGDSNIKTYQAVFFGFNSLVEEFILQYLRVGHFTEEKQLQIMVYYRPQDEESIILFQTKFPFLFPKVKSLHCEELNTESYKNVVNYTFFKNTKKEIISITRMIESEAALISTEFSLYSLLKKDSAVYIYSCLENGVKSAALLSTLLPRIAFENNSDYIKVYCYYNYLDQQEELNIQSSLCEKTQCRIPVFCFGNDLINCTTTEIENKDRDMMAKHIAHLYFQLYNLGKNETQVMNSIKDWRSVDLESSWLRESEKDKDSNRQAADHSYIKLGLMNKTLEDFKDISNSWTEESIEVLKEMEHIRWNAEKLLMGWIPIDNKDKWQQNKNLYKQQKLHHWLKRFDQLDKNEKDKDKTQIIGLSHIFRKFNQNKID